MGYRDALAISWSHDMQCKWIPDHGQVTISIGIKTYSETSGGWVSKLCPALAEA